MTFGVTTKDGKYPSFHFNGVEISERGIMPYLLGGVSYPTVVANYAAQRLENAEISHSHSVLCCKKQHLVQ